MFSLDEKQWDTTLNLIQKMIRAHPIYGSIGLAKVQELILSYMRENGWPQIYEDNFVAADIKGDPEYVDVSKFGPLYANYERFPKKNIIAVIDSGKPGPALILNGHIDVDIVSSPDSWSCVEGWKSGEKLDGKLYGRGACDMLSGVGALLTIGNIFYQNRKHWSGQIIITIVVDEEIGGNGTLRALHWLQRQGLLKNNIECLIAEPSNRKICNKSLGFLHLLINFNRSPVHMGVAKKSNSSLWDMFECLSMFDTVLKDIAEQLQPDVNLNELIHNFGIVKGGCDAAIPLSEIQVEGTLFFPESLNPLEFGKKLQEFIQHRFPSTSLCIGDFGFKGAEFQQTNLYHALQEKAPDCLELEDSLFPSPCDARLFKKYNIPTVIYGPGFLEQAHAVDEYIDLHELRSYIKHLLRGVSSYFDF